MMLLSSLTARCLVAVLVVATVVVGDVGGSGPVSAQTGATATFSHDPIYSDVPTPERDLFEGEKLNLRRAWIEHGRVWFEDGETNRIDSLSSYWAIQSLARAGVFDGTDCGVGRFCPDAHVPRWQLAVWLMRSLGETRLGNIDESRFADVDADEWWAPYVERMAEGQFHRSVHGSGHDDRCQLKHRPMEVPACQAYRWRCTNARRSAAR